MASDFVLPALPLEADPVQPSGSRGGTSQASQGHPSLRVASFDPVCFLDFAFFLLLHKHITNFIVFYIINEL